MPDSRPFTALAAALCAFALAHTATAGEAAIPLESTNAAPDNLSNLTLANFFTAGWTDAWAHRSDPDGAPDMALLRVTNNFMEREFRSDFYSEQNVNSRTKEDVQFLDGLISYSFNRRFMLEVVSSYEWDGYRMGDNQSGAAGAGLARFQLVDIPGSSYALTVKAAGPDTGIGGKQTDIAAALSGWEDLTHLGLSRTGLYFHIQNEAYAGAATPGMRRDDLTYDISLAKTWTRPDMPALGNFTTFVEGYGVTNLNGSDKGGTTITVTPGVRTTLWHGNVLMAGVDLPVSNPRPFDITYRITYVINF